MDTMDIQPNHLNTHIDEVSERVLLNASLRQVVLLDRILFGHLAVGSSLCPAARPSGYRSNDHVRISEDAFE